jgi:tRNA(fMet)-specific endonuclease VapC
MEETDLILCDTDVLIEFLDYVNDLVKQKLEEIGFSNICFSSITSSELIFGAKNKKHHLRLSTFISNSIVIPIDKEISDLHFELVKKYTLSHRLNIQDASIAATAIIFDLPFYSNNKKDFKFIEGLKLAK